MKRKQRNGEDGNKAIDAGTLVRREDPPPTNRAVGQNHSHIEWNHCRQDSIQVLSGDHLRRGKTINGGISRASKLKWVRREVTENSILDNGEVENR